MKRYGINLNTNYFIIESEKKSFHSHSTNRTRIILNQISCTVHRPEAGEWFKPPSSAGPVIGTTPQGRLMLTSHSPVQTSSHFYYRRSNLKIFLSDSEASQKLATSSASVSAHICTATSPCLLVLQLIFLSLCVVALRLYFSVPNFDFFFRFCFRFFHVCLLIDYLYRGATIRPVCS